MEAWKRAVAVAAFAVVIGNAQPARAAFWEDAGWGTLTVLSNVLYMPAKLVYATLGGVTGGLAYGVTLGNLDVASKIWVPSLAGTYVVTPSMLRGEEAVRFVGADEDTTASTTAGDDPPLARARPRGESLGEEPLPPQ